MSEESMVELVQEALRAGGVDDEVIAVGQFYPVVTPAGCSPAGFSEATPVTRSGASPARSERA